MMSRAGWLVFTALVGCAPVPSSSRDAGTSDASDSGLSPFVGVWRWGMSTPAPRTEYELIFETATSGRLTVYVEECTRRVSSEVRFTLASGDGGAMQYVPTVSACARFASPCGGDAGAAATCDRAETIPFTTGDAHTITIDRSLDVDRLVVVNLARPGSRYVFVKSQ